QWAISFAQPKRCADRPLLRRRNSAKFNKGLWCQPDEHRGSQQYEKSFNDPPACTVAELG
ncbi:hypothetical protein, partial [Tabrizicola caldifontis]|uniref:hypothetical protein n=1 Tax=Tabrizicola caldifontis TaxID=2528036 RepID=UPI00197CB596